MDEGKHNNVTIGLLKFGNATRLTNEILVLAYSLSKFGDTTLKIAHMLSYMQMNSVPHLHLIQIHHLVNASLICVNLQHLFYSCYTYRVTSL